MFVHARSGAASYAACLRLFRSYPLAVVARRDGWQQSIVLRCRAVRGDGTGGREFFVLSQDSADHFVLRPWGIPDRKARRIRPVEPVPAAVHEVITEGMPVPRDGALLGWVSDRQVSALLSAHHGHPSGPQLRVLPMAGTEPLHWPPFTTSPLASGRLWEYFGQGRLVDLAPVVARTPDRAFWVPSQSRDRAMAGHGCVVVSANLPAEDFWLPVGVYLDHWMLREGVPAPPASHLLALPGTEDLAGRLA